MTPPSGTFLAQVRNGVVQFPPSLKEWCEHSGWTLFRVAVETRDRLSLQPVDRDDQQLAEYQSSFDPQGRLWIPADLRAEVSLGEQSVMIRVEDGLIRIFLRKVFETLGFGP